MQGDIEVYRKTREVEIQTFSNLRGSAGSQVNYSLSKGWRRSSPDQVHPGQIAEPQDHRPGQLQRSCDLLSVCNC